MSVLFGIAPDRSGNSIFSQFFSAKRRWHAALFMNKEKENFSAGSLLFVMKTHFWLIRRKVSYFRFVYVNRLWLVWASFTENMPKKSRDLCTWKRINGRKQTIFGPFFIVINANIYSIWHETGLIHFRKINIISSIIQESMHVFWLFFL